LTPSIRPTSRLGPYEVGPKIGGGGMATVFLGRRVEGAPDGEIVAIKVIKDELAQQSTFVHMFLDEAKILSRLSHPRIIETRHFGVTEQARFIAMELLLGRSLMDAWDVCHSRETRVPLDLAAYIALAIADALTHAHDLKGEEGKPLNLIHRDVNPTNVFLTYDGEVKLIDFGLAKAEGRVTKSAEGVVKGKVPYLSPEQVAEQPIDRRTDIYALGATIWEMTTGKRLFKRDTDLETIRAIRAQEIPDPRTIAPGLYPDALHAIVDRALQRDPAARYATAEEMAADLRAFLTKHGRKAPMPEILSSWLEELFPGEHARQKAWLAKVSGMRAKPRYTMRPPVPLAEVPSDRGSATMLDEADEPVVSLVPPPNVPLPKIELPPLEETKPKEELAVDARPSVTLASEAAPRESEPTDDPAEKVTVAPRISPPPEPPKKKRIEAGSTTDALVNAKAPDEEPTASKKPPSPSLGRALVVLVVTLAIAGGFYWWIGK
jgi:serine/threonine-protein kinase